MQAVFQDPYSSLSPRMLIWSIVSEPLEIQSGMSKQEINDRVTEVLQQVGLSAGFADRHPHELRGGQRQRVALARAIGPSPRHIVPDEPVAAVAVSIRNQIVYLLKDLQEQFGISYLIISRDLTTVRHLSHEVAVMYSGKVMEHAGAKEFVCGAAASVHQGPPRYGRAATARREEGGNCPERRGPQPAQSSKRLPVAPTLPIRYA